MPLEYLSFFRSLLFTHFGGTQEADSLWALVFLVNLKEYVKIIFSYNFRIFFLLTLTFTASVQSRLPGLTLVSGVSYTFLLVGSKYD